MKQTVVNAGVAVADEVYFLPGALVPGEKHRAANVLRVIGGNGANAALAIARLGGDARLLTRTGADAAGEALRAGLAAESVDFSLSPPISGRTTSTSTIIVEPDGARTIVNHFDRDFPDRPEWLPTALPAGTGAVLGDVRWETGTRQLFELANQKKMIAVFDGDRKPIDSMLITLSTHRVFSAQALREMTRTSDLAVALECFAKGRDGYFGVTDGGHGVYSYENGNVVHYQAFAVDVVDTLGAGDVWHGAFALALAERQPLPEAIRFASAAAALKCARRGGGMGAPSRAEVERMLGRPVTGS